MAGLYEKLIAKLTLKRDYKETFETPHGQRVLSHILRAAGVTRPISSSDIQQTWINEGARRLAMSIFDTVSTSETALLQQMKEELEKQETE